jgi:hypothetical protein
MTKLAVYFNVFIIIVLQKKVDHPQVKIAAQQPLRAILK